jgi:hypothetical protein
LIVLDSIPLYLRWLKHLSFFNYAFEALIVNEMVYLQLTEKKYGLEIDVSIIICIAYNNNNNNLVIIIKHHLFDIIY